MSIKTRRFLFYSLVALFLVLGTFLVFNSRGYRLDLKSFQIEATGGIYISATPPKVEIQLDGEKIKNQSGVLQRGTLVDKLPPGEYLVGVTFEGYSPWRKNVEVQSGSVSVFDSIVLVPDSPEQPVSDSLAERVTAAGKHIALESGGGVSLNDTLVFGHKIVSLTESGTLLTQSTATGNYYLANAFKPEENLNLTLTFNNLKSEKLGLPGPVDIEKILPYPYNDHRFVIATARALYLLDTDKLSIEQVTSGASDFFLQGQNSFAWVEEGKIKTFNLPLRGSGVALDLESVGIEDSIVKIHNAPIGWIGLGADGNLIRLIEDASERDIAPAVRDFIPSPSGQKLAVLKTDGSLFVYDFETARMIDMNLPGAASDPGWFKDDAHLLALVGGNLIFADVSAASPENQVVLGTNVSSFSYPGGGSVYFANNSGVWVKKITN